MWVGLLMLTATGRTQHQVNFEMEFSTSEFGVPFPTPVATQRLKSQFWPTISPIYPAGCILFLRLSVLYEMQIALSQFSFIRV